MKNIVLFDTSSGSLNQGDYIIMQSAEKQLRCITKDSFTLKFPTHTPCFFKYQQFEMNPRYSFVKNADYKFLCGTNIIQNKIFIPWPFWNIDLLNYKFAKGLIGVAVGSGGYENKKCNWYSKMLYKSVFSDKYIHSARDQKTVEVLESMGKKAINTGCVTMWGLTKEHCKQIPTKKAKNVIFTINASQDGVEIDRLLIAGLLRNYENVYFWPQGMSDYNYLCSIGLNKGIKVVSPDIVSYSDILNNGDIDYFGTRLHGGIFAMQHKIRTTIVIVDNRARDINNNYGINCIEKQQLNEIDYICNNEFETKVNLNENAIKEWRNQFTN